MRQLSGLIRLIDIFRALPGIGYKTAVRIAYHILTLDTNKVEQLTAAINNARKSVVTCSICGVLAEIDPCQICIDDNRSTEIICVVESVRDVEVFERSGEFNGRYHVLNGVLSPLDGIGPNDLNIKKLLVRLSDNSVNEIIIATDSNVEGEATALYLAQLIKPLNIKVTRLAHGMPVGSNVEYVDEITVARAVANRNEML